MLEAVRSSRAELVGLLNVEVQVMVGQVVFVVGGVADALEIASRSVRVAPGNDPRTEQRGALGLFHDDESRLAC